MTLDNVTEAQLTELLSGLSASGQAINEPKSPRAGTIKGRGVTAAYSLTPDGLLSIDVIHGPWGVPRGMIDAHILKDVSLSLLSMGWRPTRIPAPAEQVIQT